MIPWFNIQFPSILHYIHMFGILVATGILVGARLTRNRGRELGLQDENVASMITFTLLCGFLFAHIFDVFAYQTAGPSPTLWQILNPLGGLSSYGGFVGAVSGLVIWCKRRGQKIMPYADSLAYGLAAGWLFGRLGCFSAHDHPGRLTTFWLSLNYGNHYPGGIRHDLGLDEAIWAALMTLLFALLSRRKRPLGLYLALLTTCYAPVRFCLDFLRATDLSESDPRYFGLTPAQYGSIAVLFVGIAVLIWMRGQRSAK
jgi:phosphatidylglycerol:prolipoprotein diacylglycerol transferase